MWIDDPNVVIHVIKWTTIIDVRRYAQKTFFIIKRTTDLKCLQKGSIIIFEDSDIDESMQPLCVRWCPERYQNSPKTECQFCDESCNVTVAMKHYDKATGLTIGLSSLALAFSVMVTAIIILYCAFKRRRIKRRKVLVINYVYCAYENFYYRNKPVLEMQHK